MYASGYEARKMRHIDEQQCAAAIGDRSHARKIEGTRICAAAADDQLRLLAVRDLLEFVVIDGFGVFANAVRGHAVELAGKIEFVAMRQMTAMCQIESQNGIA